MLEFAAIHTCYCVNMVSVTSALRYTCITSASRYHPRYQSISSVYIRCLIPRNVGELDEAVPIGLLFVTYVYFTQSSGIIKKLRSRLWYLSGPGITMPP